MFTLGFGTQEIVLYALIFQLITTQLYSWLKDVLNVGLSVKVGLQ